MNIDPCILLSILVLVIPRNSEELGKMERRLFPVKGNKGGIMSRSRREQRRSEPWREKEEETFKEDRKTFKDDRKMTDKDNTKTDWNKEGLWTVNTSYSRREHDVGIEDNLSRKE